MAHAAAAGDPFEALGDPNRREILRLLSAGDKPVQEIAAGMPISRPAVSRHLRLLKDAGLVTEQAEGTRRIYHLHEEGLAAVQAYLEGVWGDAASRFRLLAENTTPPPGRSADDAATAVLPRRRLLDRARLLGLDQRDRHLVAARPHRLRRAGRRSCCRAASAAGSSSGPPDGDEHDWGEVTVWEPPTTLAYLWHLGRDRDAATEVEIQFVPQGLNATRIEIEHRGWDRLADDAPVWRERNQIGWQTLLPHFQAAVLRGDS